MELGKNSNSDGSSHVSSDNQTEIKSSSDGIVRSYECTFCKRGFTNAQALGGHMNIHRKDKAKAKHKINQEEASLNKSNLRYVSQVSSHDSNQLRVVGGDQRNYQVYLPSSNPNFQTGNCLPLWRPDLFEGRVVQNSSLRVEISQPRDEDEGDGIIKGTDVDLELRLGHQP